MKKLAIVILCLCVVFVGGFAGYRGYKIWKQKKLVKQAREFIAKGDAPNALLCLRQALQKNANNIEACRLMAAFAEMGRSPQAVHWRSRLVELEPNSITNRLALARTAVSMGDALTAQKALEGVDEAGKKSAGYQTMAGTVDLATRRLSEAEAHFAEAARLEPANPVSQLNLALLRLQKTNLQAAAEGRTVLQGLCTNSLVRCDALRQLTMDALRNTNLNAALGFSQALLQDTNATFGDRLVHLGLLRASTNSQLAPFLQGMQAESTNNPVKAYEVAKWMLTSGNAGQSLAWLKGLPPVTRTNLPVPMLEADCYLALKDWPGLLTNSASQSWGELDCLRLACRARAFREQGMSTSAKTEWLAAMNATDNRSAPLMQLLNATGAWKWNVEQEDVLWAIIDRYPKEQWAVQALSQRLYAAGRTRSLLDLYEVAARNDKQSLALINNLALTALLLEAWDKKPHALARDVYQKAPTNSAFASTYAFSLYLQNKNVEALQVMEKLAAKDLEAPGIAGYYGLILQANGKPEKARPYFELTSKGPLLPEEKKLMEKARGRT
jgi:predicted Zn-dependent protease